MMKSEHFLDLYRQIEDGLDSKYANKKRKYSSVVIEFLNSNESIPFRENLDCAREVRNILSHNAKIDGEFIIEPSEALCKSLEDLLEYINKPPLAIGYGTSSDKILFAGINQTVLKIMKIMNAEGFSHIPVLDNGIFEGVFSSRTVFSYILSNFNKPVTRQTTIKEMKELLPIKTNQGNYEFCGKGLTLFEAREKFTEVHERNKRLAVIFITENGRESEKILAMLTPWDVMKE